MAQDVAISTNSAQQLQPLKQALAIRFAVKLKPSTTYVKGQPIGPITATPGTYGPYASGNVDGTQVAECFVMRACITDAAGMITYADVATGALFGQKHLEHVAMFSGAVLVADTTGVDAACVTALKGRIVNVGTVLIF